LITIPKTELNVDRSIYILKGSEIKINNGLANSNTMVELHSEQELILENIGTDTKILLLQGKPINEPVAKYGPFVMNTRSEIQQAFDDYNSTGFGGWKWDSSGPIHGEFKGRFAKLINGKIDKPS
jgi:hypothetical protein